APPIGSRPVSVALKDVNGDGRPDLITADQGPLSAPGGTVGVLLGNGDGSFQPQRPFPVGKGLYAVAVADANGDGRPDLVVANGVNSVSVLLGQGDGTFATQRTFAGGIGPTSVAVADVNGDGRPDLVTANIEDNTVGVLLGQGD